MAAVHQQRQAVLGMHNHNPHYTSVHQQRQAVLGMHHHNPHYTSVHQQRQAVLGLSPQHQGLARGCLS